MQDRSNGGPRGDDADGSLSALIGAAYDDGQGGDPQIGGTSNATENEEEVGDDAAEDLESTDGENADADAEAGEGAEATEDGKAPTANAGKGKTPSTPALTAPKHWPKARADAFAKLPTPEAKKALLDIAKDLEGGFTRRSQELADKVKFADAVNGLFADHHREQMAQTRTTPIQALDYLVRLQDFSARAPRDYLRWAMQTLQQHPLDVFPELAQMIRAQGAPPAGGQPAGRQAQSDAKAASDPAAQPGLEELFQDPRVKTLEAELAQLKQSLGHVQGHLGTQEQQRRQWQEQQRQSQLQTLDRHIENFRTALDDVGQLRFPHFDAVRQRMGALMDTDPHLSRMPDGPEKLAAAYERAVRADPDIYKGIVDAEVAAKVAAQVRAQEAARAKRAAAIKPKTQIPATTATRGRALESLISDAIDQQGGL